MNCGGKSLDDDAYYCNKELVELLVFDAKVTNESYQTWQFKNEKEQEFVEMYGAQVRFIATMSGLTRWQFIFGEIEVDSDQEFGDYHSSAIESLGIRAPSFNITLIRTALSTVCHIRATLKRATKRKLLHRWRFSLAMAVRKLRAVSLAFNFHST